MKTASFDYIRNFCDICNNLGGFRVALNISAWLVLYSNSTLSLATVYYFCLISVSVIYSLHRTESLFRSWIWNLTIHCHIHSNTPLVPVSQINPICTILPYFLKIHFNFILLSTLNFLWVVSCFQVSLSKFCIYLSCTPHVCYMCHELSII
jgi:hypothetical protein